ncbi:hypothetical protein B0J17DRAFT_666938 [Rhizoctonia solani]|nr:hypothetical protein B0J17DRAFT_666938 [Rhizoctonia solani]
MGFFGVVPILSLAPCATIVCNTTFSAIPERIPSFSRAWTLRIYAKCLNSKIILVDVEEPPETKPNSPPPSV